MSKYNYLQKVTEDVRNYIWENPDIFKECDTIEELEEKLNDDLWVEDSITGNASGSYTFSTWRAEEYISHNWDLLLEAITEFGQEDINPIQMGAEWCDVTIRCYVLSEAISSAIEDIKDLFEASKEEE